MNNYSQFDSNAAFGGGGFTPSQATQTPDNGFSSSSKNRDSQGLLPLTAKQIIDSIESSSTDNIMVDGVEVTNITMLGLVFRKVDNVTSVSFILDDGTGTIECNRWANDDFEKKEMDEIQNGMYVRIHGHLKPFQGKKQLVLFSARPVTDFNEIAYHFIECIYVHAYNTRKQNLQGNGQTQPYMSTPAMGMNGSARTQAPVSNQYSEAFRADPAVQGPDKMVLDYLSTPAVMNKETGASLADIAVALKVSRNQIMESIRKLEGEGAVYSTIDENHYKSALNG
ncbi:hypothetical protein ACHQM5_030132 [Ranunculus cassubicifolius]